MAKSGYIVPQAGWLRDVAQQLNCYKGEARLTREARKIAAATKELLAEPGKG